jgi:hypothetical protein
MLLCLPFAWRLAVPNCLGADGCGRPASLPCRAVLLQGLDRLFEGHPTAELYMVMICCPLLLNVCQVRAAGVWLALGGIISRPREPAAAPEAAPRSATAPRSSLTLALRRTWRRP